jgi:acyl-CoA synthetase (AMP-forming)/AMP-acid ligase II
LGASVEGITTMNASRALSDGETLNDLFLEVEARGSAPCFAVISAHDQSMTESVSAAELVRGARRIAAGLCQTGVGPGSRVVLVASPSTHWVEAFLGILLAGGVAVPANNTFTVQELFRCLEVAVPAAVLTDEKNLETAVSAAQGLASAPSVLVLSVLAATADDGRFVLHQPESDAPAVILFTSGTTGRPKGVVRTHAQYVHFVRWWADIAIATDDQLANFLPLYHQAGLLLTFLSGLAAGVPTFHVDKYHPATFWRVIDAHRLSWSVMMQPMPRQLLSAAPTPEDRSHALRWAFGTAGLNDWVDFQQRFDVAFHSSYGSTETTIACVTGGRFDSYVPASRIRSPGGGALCGRMRDRWAEVRITTPDGHSTAGPGFIEVKGPAVFDQYFRDEAKTLESLTTDGWFRSGDYGHIDETGDLFLLDRGRDLIRRNGENIAPREVEEAILSLDAVADCAVVGIRDDERGEEVAAFIELKVGRQVSAEEVIEHCRSVLAGFKVPRYIQYVDSFPRTNTHKIRRDELVPSPSWFDRMSGRRAPST